MGRRYVQYINRQYRRTGTLWDSRYKSSLIQAETYRGLFRPHLDDETLSAIRLALNQSQPLGNISAHRLRAGIAV
jgi:hypothetical protein